MDLKCVVHPKKGIDPEFAYEFHLDEHETFSWHWHSLVASLRDEDIDYVCGGPCSGGLVACSVSARKNSYDIKTHRADVLISQREKTTEKYKAKQEVWDFLLTRGDGSKVRLHPSHSNTKVTVAASEGHGEPVDVPGGLGGSDGRKCFKCLLPKVGHGPARSRGLGPSVRCRWRRPQSRVPPEAACSASSQPGAFLQTSLTRACPRAQQGAQ